MSSIFISEFITSQALDTMCSRHDVIYDPDLYKDRSVLIAAMQDVHALVVRNLTQGNKEVLKASPKLKVFLGVGLENIELPACAKRNIRVIPATGANAESVAEYVVGGCSRFNPWSYSCNDRNPER